MLKATLDQRILRAYRRLTEARRDGDGSRPATRGTMTLTVWFCSLCRVNVQIGARPSVCTECGSAGSLGPMAVPYVPEQTKPLHAEPFG